MCNIMRYAVHLARVENNTAANLDGVRNKVPRTWCEQASHNLIYRHEAEKGGHFAGFGQPEIYTREVRASFRGRR